MRSRTLVAVSVLVFQMDSRAFSTVECAAWALALLTAADACVGRCEIDRLEELDALRSIGMSRARFLEIAHTCRDEIGENLIGLSWLPADDLERIDRILDAVRDPQLRLDELIVTITGPLLAGQTPLRAPPG